MAGTIGDIPPGVAELKSIGLSAGLDAVGVTTAEPFEATLAEILRRREAGLHADMQFTFRNPERSTDPGRILDGARSIIVGAMRVSAPHLPDAGSGMARIAAYARHDHYGDLREALEVVADNLVAAAFAARVVADDNSLVDRAAAVRADRHRVRLRHRAAQGRQRERAAVQLDAQGERDAGALALLVQNSM